MKKSLLIHPDELSRKWIDRMAGLGVTTLGLHPTGGQGADQSLCDLLRRLEDPDYRALIDYAIDEAGLQIEYSLHAASYLMPRTMFDTHPEWFRMDGAGERVREVNFCVSNPEALAYYCTRAVELAKQLYRSTPNYYFWMDDVQSSCCHCPECSRYHESDQQMIVMNAVVTALQKEIPGAHLAHLAYHRTLTPPKAIKPAPGIFLEFAPIQRDFSLPAWEASPEYTQNILDLLGYFGRDHARVLEYWFDNSLFSRWKKPPKQFVPNRDLIRGDIRYYRELGFDDIASFACFLGEDYEALWGEPDVCAFAD